MTLQPVRIVDNVLEEYRSFLLTEFRARNPELRAALEASLDQPRFLAQDTFFQAYRPYVDGKKWAELGLDSKLAQVMKKRSGSDYTWHHQSASMEELLSPDSKPVVVTTGTGSGKTECFLLPVIQNAIEDVTRFSQSGLTTLLIYPMNALANDQEGRINDYLTESGHTSIKVGRYDRTTPPDEREKMRNNPPHILLTNYMMLEYLLVRPSDREALFKNHRCRFVVLDEVHTYRGSLGANIALLFRRLRIHLQDATQDWNADDKADARRFPKLVPVATSATIKSVEEVVDIPLEERKKLRDQAVQDFVSKLVGEEPESIRVFGEEKQKLDVPEEARWTPKPVAVDVPEEVSSEEAGPILARLCGIPETASLAQAAASCGVLWKLHELLAQKPLSVEKTVQEIIQTVPERSGASEKAVTTEVQAAIAAGTALPDEIPGALRLRANRFIRGGWRFERCVDPECGKLYPSEVEKCECGATTAPLYICRSCGAHTLRFKGEEDPSAQQLVRNDSRDSDGEWMLYDVEALNLSSPEDDDLDIGGETGKQMKKRPVFSGSFDPATCSFSMKPEDYPVRAMLAPARNQCLVCGAFAGAGSILTPVALGTSAAVRVISEGLVESLAEQHEDMDLADKKERLLIFADSRQDAAHQARFITYASRYDRMRRRLVKLLKNNEGSMSFEAAVQGLLDLGVEAHDNPLTQKFEADDILPPTTQQNAKAWEEAPLLDDISVSAGYRATVFNLGLVGVRYAQLEKQVEAKGDKLTSLLGVTKPQLLHLCRCVLDEIRVRKAFSRPMLWYHPLSTACPESVRLADWERRVMTPNGYALPPESAESGYVDPDSIPEGIRLNNVWRKPKAGGRGPSLERKFKHLLNQFNPTFEPSEGGLLALMQFLMPTWLVDAKLFGYKKAANLLQVNADSVELVFLKPEDRFRCTVCNVKLPWSVPGAPCPACHGEMEPWPEEELQSNRYVQRILKDALFPLVAGEHTAQLTGEARIELENRFKAPSGKAPENVLACSPTLEMGIDVGGLDAVVMRNIPPRPDNYAQRGGRAGRRSRVGVVLGYARHTPHDAYFFDHPDEMIAGEVPAPAIGLGNRDVILRHLAAIAFGLAEPGLKGRMMEYVKFEGEIEQEAVDELVQAVLHRVPAATEIAWRAWGPTILEPAGLMDQAGLEAAMGSIETRIRDLFDRVSWQVIKLGETIEQWSKTGNLADRAATAAMSLKKRLLGIPLSKKYQKNEADDRSAGHPMRRFAEFGILPGYEFPTEPATLRLWGDQHEESPISVERRFGISQYEPDAPVHARAHRWRVIGLDQSSPWNPKSPEPTWKYTVCEQCGLRFGAQTAKCPRCYQPSGASSPLPGFEFGGFLATRQDRPVLEEEDRFARASRVRIHPQRGGDIIARYRLPGNWTAALSRGEEVRWVNEFKPTTEGDLKRGVPILHQEARGFYLCQHCGRLLKWADDGSSSKKKKKAKTKSSKDNYGHNQDCPNFGQPPMPLAIVSKSVASVFRIEVVLPWDIEEEDYLKWGWSLGFALRTGIRGLYMLDGSEIEFVLEDLWEVSDEQGKRKAGSLTFIDAAVGGSGFLDRAAGELHLVAHRALEHLDHGKCESACYRCLKSYQNQRIHRYLNWPQIVTDLEMLAAQAPEAQPGKLGDIQDPKPWLEAYAEGVGSPLELKFLRLFEKNGIQVAKQVPVAPDEGGAPISTADFAIPDSKVAIYIDGAAFHTGNRLRRDRIIRKKLSEGNAGWKVLVFMAKDLANITDVIDEVKSQL